MIKKIILCAIVFLAVVWIFAWPYPLSGDCMEPVVKDNSYVFLNRLLPYLRSFKIGDIILFNHEKKIWIARIVALENDTIEILQGTIIINGHPLADTVERNWHEWNYGTYAIGMPLAVPVNHVYVLSDNLSAHHDDSRVFGPISQKSILGIVWKTSIKLQEN